MSIEPRRPGPIRHSSCRPTCSLGIEGGRARARHVLHAGETVYCALAWSEEARVPTTVEEAFEQLEATTMFWRDWLARAVIPDHELGPLIQRSALTIKGLTYMPTGADRRGAHHLAAGDTRRGAELGLPLHLDPRLDLPAAGAALPAPRLGGRRVHAVHRRPRAQRRWRTADHVRDRRSPGSDRIGARGPVRLRRRTPRPRSATAPSTSGRTTSSEPRSTRSCCTAATASVFRGACGRSCRPRPSAPKRCGVSPTRASGRRAASRGTTSRRS